MADTPVKHPNRSRRRRLRILALVVVLLIVASSALFSKLFRPRCDHSDLVPHGLVQYRSEINVDQANTESKALLHLAFERRLIGMDRSSIESLVAAADTTDVGHDGDFAPIADVCTFELPCLHRNIADGTQLQFSVTVSRSCGHVIDVRLTARPDF